MTLYSRDSIRSFNCHHLGSVKEMWFYFNVTYHISGNNNETSYASFLKVVEIFSKTMTEMGSNTSLGRK